MKECTGSGGGGAGAAALTAIGSHADGSQKFFGGLIDAVRVYVRGLDATEVLEVYNEAPVLHLRLDEAYGATQFADNAATLADNANTGACVSDSGGEHCPVTGAGITGPVEPGRSLRRRGRRDPGGRRRRAPGRDVHARRLGVPHGVNPNAPQEIIVRSDSEVGGEIGPQPTYHANYRLYLKPNTLIPVVEFDAGCTDVGETGDQPGQPDQGSLEPRDGELRR